MSPPLQQLLLVDAALCAARRYVVLQLIAPMPRQVLLSVSLAAQDLKRRKYETEDEKEELVPQLREVSRQEYLKKREEQKIAELEDALRDEELLFA